MLCYHPHGALSVGFAWNGAHTSKTDVYKVTWLVVDILPKLPIMGYVVNWFGNMRGVSPPVMRRFLESGRNVGLIPGGFEEATIMKRGVERVYLRRRKGFVKYALRYGYNLHPACERARKTIRERARDQSHAPQRCKHPASTCRRSLRADTFGESDTYLTFHWFVKARLALNRFKLPAIAVFGDPLFPLFPRPDTRINTFVGDALVLPHLPEPTDAQVDEWHTRYIEALQALFDSKKAAVGKPEAVLEIW